MKYKKIYLLNFWPNAIILLALNISSLFVFAQQDSTIIKKDSTGIGRAIYWTKKGQHDKAKQICQAILLNHKHDAETEILLGRLYSWDKQFDSARIYLKDAINYHPANEEALEAIINVELWSNHLDQALQYCDKALVISPNSQNLFLKKAKVYNKQAKYKEAYKTVEDVLKLNPDNSEAIQFREYLKKKMYNRSLKNGVGISYQYDHFNNNTYSPWNYASLYLFHKGGAGTVSGSINFADRFNAHGIQYELNLYPRISSSTRGYLGASYSKDSIFPAYNLGAGLSQKLFKWAEIEGGARYLSFRSLPDPILIYTGAVNVTYKRIWASVCTYLTPQPAGVAESYYFTMRYHMKNPGTNVTMILSTGLSPHDYTDPVSGKNYNYPIQSRRIKMAWQTAFFSPKNILKCSLAYEKRSYYTGINRERISTGIGFERLF